MEFLSKLPIIERVSVSNEELRNYSSEQEFMVVSFNLLKEITEITFLTSGIVGNQNTWTLEKAVIGGNLIRLGKILNVILDQLSQKKYEPTAIFGRLCFETSVNIKYLIKHASNHIIKDYITHSLKHEKKLYEDIQKNILLRNGIILPIEDRMMKSIERMLRASNISLDEIPSSKKGNSWGETTFRDKCTEVDLEEAYTAIFGSLSNNVHGLWQDLYSFHIELDEHTNTFVPQEGWKVPRPQLALALCAILIETISEAIPFLANQKIPLFDEHLSDLNSRVLLVDEAHEIYLSKKTWPEI